MRWPVAFLAALVLFPAIATAHETTTTHARITLEVDDRGNCADGRAMCFSLTGGSFDDVHQGAAVELTFRNTGRAEHDLLVDARTERVADHTATEEGGFFAASERPVAPGEEDTFTFRVPGHWTGLYLWCSVAGHEESGLWMAADITVDAVALPAWGAWVALLCGAALRARCGGLMRR